MSTTGDDDRRECWSIQQVARMSGVTARTLRYYDEIGLVRPARIGGNGYRYYEQPQLLRLQEILLLRELGMDLGRIGQVVGGERDKVEALRNHHRRLVEERDRFDRLARTVAATIESLRKGAAMSADEMFQGFEFTPEMLDELQARELERTGTSSPYYDRIRERLQDWDQEAFRRFERDSAAIERRLLELLQSGIPCDDEAVFVVLQDDLEVQRRILALDPDSYVRLGEAFVQAPELRAHLDAQHPRLAEYLRDAMAAFAQARMRDS